MATYWQNEARLARRNGDSAQARDFERHDEGVQLAGGLPIRQAFRLRHRHQRERLRDEGIPAADIPALAASWACHGCGYPQPVNKWAKDMATANRWRRMWPDSARYILARIKEERWTTGSSCS